METLNKQPKSGDKQTETLSIRNVTITPVKDDLTRKQYVLHTTPSKLNPPREGEKESRFRISEKVFENLANSAGKPAFIFMKECVGAKYTRNSQFVEPGDSWLNGGNGTHEHAHWARVSESIELSAFTQAEDLAAARQAYYASKFAPAKSVATPHVAEVPTRTNDEGKDIMA